jgi:hypothetical protein
MTAASVWRVVCVVGRLVRDNNQKTQSEDCDYQSKTDYLEVSLTHFGKARSL